MSRCRPCESAAAVGAAAEGTGCISVTGAGTDASPFQIALGAACLPLIACTSVTRPASPAEGQEIFEIDTDRTRIWNGSIWKLVNPITTGVDEVASGGGFTYGPATPGYPGPFTVLTLTITEPFGSGDPFAAIVSGRFTASDTNNTDIWDVFLESGASTYDAARLSAGAGDWITAKVGPAMLESTDGSAITANLVINGDAVTGSVTDSGDARFQHLRASVFAL